MWSETPDSRREIDTQCAFLGPKQAFPPSSDRMPAGRSFDGASPQPPQVASPTPGSNSHARCPFLGLAPARVEASRPRLQDVALTSAATGAAPPPPGTTHRPRGPTGAAGTPGAAPHAPPGRATAPPPSGTA